MLFPTGKPAGFSAGYFKKRVGAVQDAVLPWLFRKGFDNMLDKTMTFSVHEDREDEMKEILTTVYDALKQKGYNPINQLVGYILSEDPTYITTFNNARGLIRHIDRDELLQVLVKSYLNS